MNVPRQQPASSPMRRPGASPQQRQRRPVALTRSPSRAPPISATLNRSDPSTLARDSLFVVSTFGAQWHTMLAQATGTQWRDKRAWPALVQPQAAASSPTKVAVEPTCPWTPDSTDMVSSGEPGSERSVPGKTSLPCASSFATPTETTTPIRSWMCVKPSPGWVPGKRSRPTAMRSWRKGAAENAVVNGTP